MPFTGTQPNIAPPSRDFIASRGAHTHLPVAVDAKWKGDYCCCYGTVTPVCVSAWVLFLAIPLLFYVYVLPTDAQLGDWTRVGFICLYVASAVFYILSGCWNPGVPDKPLAKSEGDDRIMDAHAPLPHPGIEYTLSRDSNRYVRGFDHYCEFVGNDIGNGNMYCFVGFLAILALLSTYVVVFSGVGVYFMAIDPPHVWHLLLSPWRVAAAAITLCLLLVLLRKCVTSDVCSGVGALVMAMPGASAGAFLLFVVLVITIIAPFITDMFLGVTPETNPTAFFLILPTLAFAVLFWGMGLHWVLLMCSGMSQKLWLKAKGLNFGRRRPQLV